MRRRHGMDPGTRHGTANSAECGRSVPNRVIRGVFGTLRMIQIWTIRAQHILDLTQACLRDSLLPMSAVRMSSGHGLNRVFTAVGFVLTLYFSYHCVAGNHGLFALIDLREREGALAEELALVRAERNQFEQKVDLLDQRHLDPDLLEESARTTLGYAHPDDLVILRPSVGSPTD